MRRSRTGLYTAMAFGYAFLYIPIFSVIVYSFNASRISTIWGGFSTRWYVELLGNQQLLDAVQRSFIIAALTATAAVMLGTACGLALSRFGRFPGRGLLSLMNSAPMVMPDVMMGLSSLLLFGWRLACTPSRDDRVIASFTSGPGSSTLPMVVYSKVKMGVTPEINALATIIVVLVALGVSIAGLVMHRSGREAT